MPFHQTSLPGLLVFEPAVFGDDRGYFFESYNKRLFDQQGLCTEFLQDNQSQSKYGVIRGLHFQLNPHSQTKLVRVLYGTVIDAVVDIRKGSPTYGQTFTVELSAKNKKQLLVPVGFAHGFAVVSESATVLYKCDAFWNRESEGGIRFDDPVLNIDWGIPRQDAVVIEKDLQLPLLADCHHNFVYTT